MVHVIILKGVKYSFTQGQLQWMLTMFLAYGTGAILYATRFPGEAYLSLGNLFKNLIKFNVKRSTS